MTDRRKAISYSRFSSPEQAEGDSESRQAKAFARFCEAHDLQPTSVLIDRGLSGFRGDHRVKGEMGRLEEMVRKGRIERGTVLVVEAWDRLGRQRPDEQIELISGLLRAGLSIGVTRLNDIFTERDLGTDKFLILSMFLQLAYQESKQKSERLQSAWRAKKERARNGEVMSDKIPAWLHRVGDRIEPIPERVLVIKRIFRWAIEGHGSLGITRKLNAEGVPPFGERRVRKGRAKGVHSGLWSVRYVGAILTDRRVLGEHQPRVSGGKPDGDPIPNYYPAVVDEATYQRARIAAEGRKLARPTRSSRYMNLFAGLIVDERDGSAYDAVTNQHGSDKRRILVNRAGRQGTGKFTSFPLVTFERAVCGLLKEVKPADVLDQDTAPDARITALEIEVQRLRDQIAKLTEIQSQEPSLATAKVLRAKENQERELSERLGVERANAVHPLADAWKDFRTLLDVLDRAPDPLEARVRLKALLRRIITGITLRIIPRGQDRYAFVVVTFASGRKRSYLILHRAARGNPATRTPGSWHAFATRTPGSLHALMTATSPGGLTDEQVIETTDGLLDLRRRGQPIGLHESVPLSPK